MKIKLGFSLAEMMIVMLVLTVVLAAATPIITKRATQQIKASGNATSSGLKFNPLGTVTSNITLMENAVNTAYFPNATTVTLPTITDTTKQTTCILDFTTASGGYPTITNTNVLWSDQNGGKAPVSYSTLAGIQNRITFKSIFKGASLYWEADYSYYGGVKVAFTNPNMASKTQDGFTVTGDYRCDGVDYALAPWSGVNTYGRGFTNAGSFAKLSFPTGDIYIQSITIYRDGSAYQQSHYGTITLYKSGTVVKTLANQLFNWGTSTTFNIPDTCADAIMFSGLNSSQNQMYDGGDHSYIGHVVVSGYKIDH